MAHHYSDFHPSDTPMSLWDPEKAVAEYGEGLKMTGTANPGDGLGIIDDDYAGMEARARSSAGFYGIPFGTGVPDPVVEGGA